MDVWKTLFLIILKVMQYMQYKEVSQSTIKKNEGLQLHVGTFNTILLKYSFITTLGLKSEKVWTCKLVKDPQTCHIIDIKIKGR